MMEKENKTSISSKPKGKQFEEIQLEVIHFDCKDVITSSGGDDLGGIHDTWGEVNGFGI